MANISLMSGGCRQQKGLTLVEILVALTLGLVVTAMALEIFFSSKRVYLTQEQSSGIQENGNFGLEWLSKYIRLAGYRSDPTINMSNAFLRMNGLAQCNRAFGRGQVVAGLDNVAGRNNSDCIIFRYRGSSDNSITDCYGDPRDETQTVINIFFLAFDQDTNDWTLRCLSMPRGGGAQTFVNNVQDMQILYGTNAGNYLNATQITNANLWNNVISVKIALLLRSDDNISSRVTDQNQTYVFPPWSTQPVTANDFRLRRVFTTTINLRN